MTSDVVAPASETTASNGHGEAHPSAGLKALLIGSIGVVYGDIGTSPLYAFKASLQLFSRAPGPVEILGILSLIFWSLVLIVTVKYVT